MTNSAYEECLDLMQFYEVYCSKTSGVIDGSNGDWLSGLLVCLLLFGLIAWLESRKKSRNY